MIKKVEQGKKVSFPFEYLNRMQSTLASRNKARTIEEFLDIDILDLALQARACNMIQSTMADYNASDAPTKVKDNDLFYSAKNAMTNAHLKYLQFHLFWSACKEKQMRDPRILEVMELIGKIYCLDELLQDGAAVYDTGFFSPGSYRTMQKAMEQCVTKIRPQLLSLSETPYSPDHVLPSVIGNYYGDIYEQQLECAQKSRLNIDNEVPEYFESLMKPILRPKL